MSSLVAGLLGNNQLSISVDIPKLTPAQTESVPAVTTLILDATMSLNTKVAATVTDHPVEDGINITDHVRDEPDRYTIEGVVSRTPILGTADLVTLNAASLGSISTRDEDAWQALYQMLKSHVFVYVLTPDELIENLVIESLDRNKTADIGEAMKVTIGVKQIAIVYATEAELPTRPAAQSKTSDKGPVTAEDTGLHSFLHP